MKSESFLWPSIDSKGITTFKTQKGSKDIVKIAHVTSMVPCDNKKVRNFSFFCAQKVFSKLHKMKVEPLGESKQVLLVGLQSN